MGEKHYCFNTEEMFDTWGRIHVPIARKCSLHCTYCNYLVNKNVSDIIRLPGVSSKTVVGEKQISNYLSEVFEEFPETKIIGVSGPGDPFENIDQLNLLVDVMKKKYPDCILCICTNGRIYDEQVHKMIMQECVQYITLTINTMDTKKYPYIYKLYKDEKVKRDMWNNQLKIIRACVKRNIKVKINTVYLEEINDDEIHSMFEYLLSEGVSCFNLLPHILIKNGKKYCENNQNYEKLMQQLIEHKFPMMTKCQHCRADHCEHGIRRTKL